jgi:hypothetical protein
MNKPKIGINAPGHVSFQSDGIMDGLADGLRDGLLDGSGDVATSGIGHAAATSASVNWPDAMQQQKRPASVLEASQDDVPLAA